VPIFGTTEYFIINFTIKDAPGKNLIVFSYRKSIFIKFTSQGKKIIHPAIFKSNEKLFFPPLDFFTPLQFIAIKSRRLLIS
jgi:hypothetical protein